MNLSDDFKEKEMLYRAIKPLRYLWNESQNRPSSAAFICKSGCSVDRQGGRKEKECVDRLKDFFSKLDVNINMIAKVTVRDVEVSKLRTLYKPTKNKFHSEIQGKEEVCLSKREAKILAKKAGVLKC